MKRALANREVTVILRQMLLVVGHTGDGGEVAAFTIATRADET